MKSPQRNSILSYIRHAILGSLRKGSRWYLNLGKPTIIAPKHCCPSGRASAFNNGGYSPAAFMK